MAARTVPLPAAGSTSTAATLQFLGAADTVTGSRFLIRAAGASLLVDCGLYQGTREVRRRNWESFPVPPAGIDSVVLTHAHLDHSGYLPALVRDGFAGHVHGTGGTARIVPLLLADAGHLMEQDAQHANRWGYSKHDPALPLYTEDDAARVTPRLRGEPTGGPVRADGVELTLRRAGHILGSASVLLARPGGRTVLFSGDLGRPDHPLLLPPDDPPAADVVVVESTYGARRHPPRDTAKQMLADAINRTLARGGSVLVPAFAVDRTEVVLHTLRELFDDGAVAKVPVFVDSPMALAVLDIYRGAIAARAPELRPELFGAVRDPFDAGNVVALPTPEQSRTVNRPKEPCVVVSASGMASGGRVVHHLEYMLGDPRHSIVLVGYQAAGTRGRALLDGEPALKMRGRYVPVRAEVVDVPGLSVHADQDDLVRWLGRLPREPETVYVVHGEPDAAEALRVRVAERLGWCAVVPRHLELVRLDH